MTASTQGKTENFFTKMGEKPDNSINSVGNELHYKNNPKYTQYKNLTPGLHSIQARNPTNQDVMKMLQVQNRMPTNNFSFGQAIKEQLAKVAVKAIWIMNEKSIE